MDQPAPPRRRSYPCNAELLNFLRERRGWTQFEFAAIAGYSERLINKAESGRPISTAAIEILAETLSTPDAPVYFEDLICDNIGLAKEYIDQFHVHQKNAAHAIRHFLDDDVTFWVSGDPKVFPFAGEHYGFEGVNHFFQAFFSVLEVPENYDYKAGYSYLAQGQDVIIWGVTWVHPIGTPMDKPVVLTHKLTFRKGNLVRLEDLFDTQKAAQVFENAGN